MVRVKIIYLKKLGKTVPPKNISAWSTTCIMAAVDEPEKTERFHKFLAGVAGAFTV